MSAELYLRRATPEDRDAVVKIISAFGGWDYMPSYYIHMITDPDFIGVVAESRKTDGDVVAFAGAYIVNGGSTMLTKGSRVREDQHGRGVYGRVWTYLRDSIQTLYPDVKYEEFTVNVHSQLLKDSGKDKKYTELYRQPLKFYKLPASERHHTSPNNSENHHVLECGEDLLYQVLLNTNRTEKLFPKRIVITWQVYRPTIENFNIIKRLNCYITGSETSDLSKDIDLLLFGTWFHCSQHLAYTVDCYGKTENVSTLTEHIRKHVGKAFEMFAGEIRFMFFANSDLLQSVNECCVSVFGFESIEFITDYQVIVVRDI